MTIDEFAAAQLEIIRTMNFADYLPTTWRLRGDALEVSVFTADEDSEERIVNWARTQLDKVDELLIAFRLDENHVKVIRLHNSSSEERIVKVQ